MKYLVDGVVATGAGAFDPAESPPSSPVRDALPTDDDRGDPTSDDAPAEAVSVFEHIVCFRLPY